MSQYEQTYESLLRRIEADPNSVTEREITALRGLRNTPDAESDIEELLRVRRQRQA